MVIKIHEIIKVNSRPKIKTFYEEIPTVVKIVQDIKKNLRQNQIDEMIEIGVKKLGGIKKYIKKNEKVIIKPNMACCYPKDVRGLTTDVRVVLSIIKLLKNNGIFGITIAEGTSINLPSSSRYIFETTGLTRIAEEQNVPLVDLKRDNYIEFEVPENTLLKKIRIAKTIYSSDILIDVPVLKGYPFTQCCKNLMGILPDKDKPEKMHPNLPITVPELAKVVRPTLCIVDGIYGAKFHAGTKIRDIQDKKFNTILVGSDPLAVDAIGAKIWGYKLNEAELLDFKYGKKIGLGNYENIKLIYIEENGS